MYFLKNNTMRPTKYKIWDTVNKEWFDDTTALISQDGRLQFWHMYKKQLEPLEEETYIPVFFTWLFDKNWKEIYEGDIVETNNYCGKTHFLIQHETQYCGSFSSFNARHIRSFWKGDEISPSSVHCWVNEECEVIWNIYENPELLSK